MRQNAAFPVSGSSTVTWHSYRPGSMLASGTLNRNGTAFDFGCMPPTTGSGAVSNVFSSPRKSESTATMGRISVVPLW